MDRHAERSAVLASLGRPRPRQRAPSRRSRPGPYFEADSWRRWHRSPEPARRPPRLVRAPTDLPPQPTALPRRPHRSSCSSTPKSTPRTTPRPPSSVDRRLAPPARRPPSFRCDYVATLPLARRPSASYAQATGPIGVRGQPRLRRPRRSSLGVRGRRRGELARDPVRRCGHHGGHGLRQPSLAESGGAEQPRETEITSSAWTEASSSR